MMNLHENKLLFDEISIKVASELGVEVDIIKHDYYVSLILEYIVKELPEVVFKGGTSLSKCYKLISRYSEDVDLNYFTENEFSTGIKKYVSKSVAKAIDNSDFHYMNPEQLTSGRNFNVFFAKIKDDNNFSEAIKIETFLASKSFPVEEKEVHNYISDYLKINQKEDIIEKYLLYPFMIKTQCISRTFIDKIFAICDYFERNETKRNSRHIYDLYKIYISGEYELFTSDFFELFLKVKEERKYNININVSATENYDLCDALHNIYELDFFKNDYIKITSTLIYDDTSYETAKTVLKLIEKNFRQFFLDKQ